MIDTTKRLEACILDILETYTPCIGGVPLQMLEYHIEHHPRLMVLEYSSDELRDALTNLIREKRISRDVIAFKVE
jgi:hypothetical protein